MLYRRDFKLDPHCVFIQLHIPRTSGTSLRLLFNKLFGVDQCLMNYEGELATMSAAQRARYRLIAGHFKYGMHQYLAGQALYLTTVRHPVDRYLSTYAEFLTNKNSKHHALAQSHDVNEFLRIGLNSEPGPLRAQFHNLQCRQVCGQANFIQARDYIDQRYFLACPFADTEQMSQMIATLLGAAAPPMPKVHESKPKLSAKEDRMHLTPASLELLIEFEREDFLLYSYVQKAFVELRRSQGLDLNSPDTAADLHTLDGPDLYQDLRRIGTGMQPGQTFRARLLVIPEASTAVESMQATTQAGIWQRSGTADGLPRFACEEMQLLATLARDNLEIASQTAGHWLRNPTDVNACDHLRVQRRRQPLAVQSDNRCCNLCGGQIFGPGPSQRLAENGRAPACLQCGSLERHRIQYRVLQALRIGFWQQRRACQFGNRLPALPWVTLDTLPEQTPDASIACLAEASAAYDFIALSHLLERVADDQQAFDVLQQALSAQGLLLITFGQPQAREQTCSLSNQSSPWGVRRAYGRDLEQHFNCQRRGLQVLEIEECDPATQVRQQVHLFFKDAGLASQVRRWVQDFSGSARISNCLSTSH
jgi:hypothetical protein